MIELVNVCKNFKVVKKEAGLKGSIKAIFHSEYSDIEAVKGVSFQVEEGEIVGFLGPNGAGKSTTIKMMTGILKKSGGEININGFDPFKERIKYTKEIGVVFGQRTQLWWELPVRDSFEILKEIYDIPDCVYEKNMKLFCEIFALDELLPKPVRTLSLGQRMLCDISAAFLHNPKVIFLDEPTIGLDVSVKEKIRDFIKTMNRKYHTTIILTTHDIIDIEALCERVVIIDKGSIIYDGVLSEVASLIGGRQKINIRLYSQEASKKIKEKLMEEQEKGIYSLERKGEWIQFELDNQTISLPEILTYLFQNTEIRDIKIEECDIEFVLKKIYGGFYESSNKNDKSK